MKETTIAAIATPNAPGGIGIVRISGKDAIETANKIFRAVNGKPITSSKGYRAYFGEVYDGNEKTDEAVCLVFRSPKSYTGEDVVELSCHGGMYIMQRVLRAVYAAGAVPAEAGEFTKRAFLNGKKDLSEAEAVMSLISASGEEARAATLNALDGALSRETMDCRDILARSAAFLSAWVDYPDDEIPELSDEELTASLNGVKVRLNALLERFDAGQAVLEGVDTAIVGKPNVGKSTLLNALTGKSRAIVTPIAGTTRDVLEETVRVGNVTLRLADTAGIRADTDDEIERIGVERAKERFDRAALVLAVLDGSEELTEDDAALLEMCRTKRCIAVINKSDLTQRLDINEVKKYTASVVEISAKEYGNIDKLKEAVEFTVGTAGFDPSLPLITTERQRSCVSKALLSVTDALDAVANGMTADAVNVCIDCAVDELSVLTGEKATETVVNEVFKNFCVGK